MKARPKPLYLADIDIISGRRAEVQKLINQLKQLSRTEYIDPAAFVGIYVRFGDKDQAFAWLEKGYEERTGMTSLKVNPISTASAQTRGSTISCEK